MAQYDRRTRPRAISRSELFEKIWAFPAAVAARSLGLSVGGLREACSNYKIPQPPRGFWNWPPHRRRAFQVPQLLARTDRSEVLDLGPFGRKRPARHSGGLARLWTTDASDAEAALEDAPLHPCMAAVIKSAKLDEIEDALVRSFCARRLLVTNDLAKMLTECGFDQVRGPVNLTATKQQVEVTVRISQAGGLSSGRLSVSVDVQGRSHALRHGFNDCTRWTVEERYDAIRRCLLAIVSAELRSQAEQVEVQRLRDDRRAAIRARLETGQKITARRAALRGWAERRDEVASGRALVADIRRRANESGCAGELQAELARLDRMLDGIDPFSKGLVELVKRLMAGEGP